MDIEVRKTVFSGILLLGVHKLFELMSHHANGIGKFDKGQRLLFEVVIAIALIYAFIQSCPVRKDDRK